MEAKTVLVTGIGGNVGQGIIRNILSTNYPIKLIGTNTLEFSAGNHMVDSFYQVPFAYEKEYIDKIIKIVALEKVDLIIPSTDYEMNFLIAHQSKFSCKIAGGGPISTSIYLDKYKTALFHVQHNLSFVETCLPSEFKGQFNPAIAKPRKGRGSKGLIKNVQNANDLSDDEYLVQLQCEGKEITSAVYVSYLTGKIIGTITLERTLENGATTYCKVVKEFDDEINKIAQDIANKTDVKGSFNIQSIVTNDGEINPFEINCRISGTNSIRSHFGFPDVVFTIDELLYQKTINTPVISEGSAYRYLADVIYPLGVEKGNNQDDFIVF